MTKHLIFTEGAGFTYVKFLISESQIQYIINDRPYFKVNRVDIEKVTLKKESYFRARAIIPRIGYKLTILAPQTNSLRFWATPISKMNTTLIIEILKQYCKTYQIEFIELDITENIDRRESILPIMRQVMYQKASRKTSEELDDNSVGWADFKKKISLDDDNIIEDQSLLEREIFENQNKVCIDDKEIRISSPPYPVFQIKWKDIEQIEINEEILRNPKINEEWSVYIICFVDQDKYTYFRLDDFNDHNQFEILHLLKVYSKRLNISYIELERLKKSKNLDEQQLEERERGTKQWTLRR